MTVMFIMFGPALILLSACALLFYRSKTQEKKPTEPTIPKKSSLTLPPLPSGPVDMDRPDVDFDRWNWDQDIQPYIEHRLRTLLFRLINEPDERQIRTLQGEARELYALLHAKEEQKALAAYRAQNERARR